MFGKKISFRALEKSDLEVLYAWENDSENWAVSQTSEPISNFTLELFIENAGKDIFATRQLRLMIIENTTLEPVGAIDLFDFEPLHKRVGVGVLITKDKRLHGYADEAVKLIKKYVFNVLNLHQIYCNIAADNVVSLKLFENNGFEIGGVKKEWLYLDNVWTDEYFLQCIKPH